MDICHGDLERVFSNVFRAVCKWTSNSLIMCTPCGRVMRGDKVEVSPTRGISLGSSFEWLFA